MSQAGTAPTLTPEERRSATSELDVAALTKAGTFIAAAAYGIGILTVSVHLHQLGITDFSFAKPKLILTGLTVLATLALFSAFPAWVMWNIFHSPQKHTESTVDRVLMLGPVAALLIGSVFLGFATKAEPGQLPLSEILRHINWESYAWVGKLIRGLLLMFALYVPVCCAVAGTMLTLRVTPKIRGIQGLLLVTRHMRLVFAGVLASVGIAGYIYAFAGTVYPLLPQGFGGGKPYVESLVVPTTRHSELQDLGVNFKPGGGNKTQPLPILHESDKSVAVLLSGQEQGNDKYWKNEYVVVQIDKSLISGTSEEPL